MHDGMLQAVKSGYIEREIAQASYEYQKQIETGQQVIVGLNEYKPETSQPLDLFEFDPEEEEWQKGRLADAKSSRSEADVSASLHSLQMAAQRDENLMPSIIDAVKARATLGEISDRLRGVWGKYRAAS